MSEGNGLRAAAQVSRRTFLSTGAGAALAAGATAGLSALLAGPVAAQRAPRIGLPAPQWDILEWINRDGGNVDTLRGQVIVIDFFQLWCPGCNKFSGPLLSYWREKFADEIRSGQLALVKIHTVFEGHNYQTVERLKSYVAEKKITLPVGVDRHADGRRLPVTMMRYQTRGTPEMAIIDKQGIIRFQEFGYFEVPPVEALLRKLMAPTRA